MPRAEVALRDHHRVAVEQRRGEVVALAHAFREGRVAQRDAELLGNGNQRIPDHGQRDGIDGLGCHGEASPAMSMMRWPSALMRATSPGRRTVVLSGSSTMAGPVMVAPLGERLPVDDRRIDVAAGLRKPGLARAPPRGRRLGHHPAQARAARARRDRGDQRPVHGLDRALGVEELVLAQIGLVEGLDGTRAIVGADRAARQIDVDLEALSRVAHLRIARPLHARRCAAARFTSCSARFSRLR